MRCGVDAERESAGDDEAGVGKCGRCNIGDKYVCKDGPVFRCDQLDELPDEY